MYSEMYNLTKPNMCPSLYVLTETRQPLLTTNSTVHVHVLGRSGYFSFSTDTLNGTTLCKFSVYFYTEHSITTVLLQYAILYKNGMNIII